MELEEEGDGVAVAGPHNGVQLDTIHEDAFFAICGWVCGHDLARLALTCRKVSVDVSCSRSISCCVAYDHALSGYNL